MHTDLIKIKNQNHWEKKTNESGQWDVMCSQLVNKSLSLHWSYFPYPDGLKEHGVGVNNNSLNPSQCMDELSHVDHAQYDTVYSIMMWTTWRTQSICSVVVLVNEAWCHFSDEDI